MTSAAPQLVTLGETMALVAPADPVTLAEAVDFRVEAGGAESNVASHLAGLGTSTAWVSALGDDALGRRILATLQDRGVDTRWVTLDAHAPTGVYFKDPGDGVLYYRRGSAASRMSPATLAGVPLETADFVHLTGITPALSSDCAALVDAVFDRARETRVTPGKTLVSFDVNHRSALWKAGSAGPALRALARRADLVFVGLDEAATLWGCRTTDDVRELLAEPGRVIVKDGDVGATEYHGDDAVFVPAIPAEVVEAVGAGDAFAAGYLAADLRGEAASDRLLAGHRQAQLALQTTSDFDPIHALREG